MEYTCTACNGRFSKHSNLRRHVKKKHPDRLNEIAPNKNFKREAVCNECSKFFSKYSNLKKHVMKFHPAKLDQLTSAKVYLYQCEECSKNFSNRNHYKNHKKIHLGEKNIDKRFSLLKCSLCNYECLAKSVLYSHLDQRHDIKIVTKFLNLSNEEEFEHWKCNVEKNTHSLYIKAHGSYKTVTDIKKAIYVCHRSGFYVAKGSGKRHLKTQGSKKINGICPSELNVKVLKNGVHEVNFIETHVGHENDLGHLNLTVAQRMEVASKIAGKVTFSSILDDVRDSVSNDKLERMHLLTKKDLYNIQESFHLNNEAVRHKNDIISIESWINEVNDSGTVLFYKPQDTKCDRYPCLKKDDFILIIMHPGQLELLQKYANDCICIDGTHGLNAYHFELTTLLVLDDMREGFPCSFLFSNRSDEEVMCIFFKEIKEKLGRQIEPQIFMSDMAQYYYSAWLHVMLPAKFRLFCTWHVDRAWRKNLNKLNDQEHKTNVYRQLRTLLQERDAEAFSNMLQNFLNARLLLIHQNLVAILNRINVESWAYCYRLHAGINTNMHIERMHQTIKYLYLNGKHVQRLDKTIHTLMKFIKDKLFERIITVNKGKISTKIQDLRKKHKSSEELNISSIVSSQGGWEVPSSSLSEIYFVEEKNCQRGCKLVCTSCQACLHSYRCSCLDNSIRWNMCKHIHLVCQYRRNIIESPFTAAIANEKNVLIIDENKNDNTQENDRLIQILSKPDMTDKSKEHLNIEKEKLKIIHLQLIEKITTFEQLEAFKKITAPLERTLLAIESNKNENTIPTSNKSTPHNKIIDKQRRLFSTKRKSRKCEKLCKPTSEEMNTIGIKLLNI